MRKIRKRVFAAVLAAALLFTMPGMSSVAVAKDAQTGDIFESVEVQAEDDAAEETEAETEAIQEPEAETSDMEQPETGNDGTGDTEADEKELAEEEIVPDQKEDAEQGDAGAQDADTNLCAHHKEHTQDCGYSPASEDGEGSPCTYECRICSIEDLIAALPDEVTEDNAKEVRGQLDKILALYRELTAEEQEQIDLTRCYDLLAALDEVGAPVTADGHAGQQEGDEASVDIGGSITYYSTLEEAFSAANGKTATITMLTDAECTSNNFNNPSPLVISGGTVTLDMNGKTLSGSGYGLEGAIIGVSGGFLTVQGGGTVAVQYCGMICTGGTLTVADTTFNLVGPDIGSADCAIFNGSQSTGKGGMVIINGATITGAASDSSGQIYHYAGTTIINDVTTTDGARGVFFLNDGKSSGKLTITGGTFNNTIVVDFSDEGIQSVKALLGDGYAYKHLGGTWATDDDLAGLSISNVTVEKIPLTINPQAETSWYYNSGAHSLQMNAVPATAGGTITYEWYAGNTKLDCTADAYPVPATTDVGNYTYICKATCDGYTLSHEFTFTVEACPHTGLVYKPQANNKHGGTCPDCGTVVSEEHTWVDGVCSVCNLKAVAKVEKDGVILAYTTEDGLVGVNGIFGNESYAGATVTLLTDVNPGIDTKPPKPCSACVNITCTLDLAGHKFTSSETAIYIEAGGKLTIQDSSPGKTGQVISTSTTNPTVCNYSTLTLTGGTYIGETAIYAYTLTDALPKTGETRYAYFDTNDNPIPLSDLVEGQTMTLHGTVTVKECNHTGVKITHNNDGTHSLNCPYCGYTKTANCSYGTEYKHNDTYHWQTCMVCGYQKTEAHTLNFEPGDTVNGVTTNYERCDCGFFKAFTVTVTVPSSLTYGKTGDIKPSYTVNPVKPGDTEWDLVDMGGKVFKVEGDTLPANLPAGDYRLWICGYNDGKPAFAGTTIFTVSPAPLTGEMVTLSSESVGYNGTEQKPIITVKQGETTLIEGKDYDVTYSTTDFTNAGTVIVTITGKGNYNGTVEKTYTIKKAVLTAGTGTANGTYGAKLSDLLVTGLTAVYQGTVTEVPGTWKLTGDTIPGVGDSGKYTTATFTPASGAGNYEPLTAQVTLNIEKAKAPTPPEGTLYVQNNREQSYQYDLTQLLPALENGKSYGTVSYELGTDAVNILENFYTDSAEITGTTLTLPIEKAETADKTKIGTVSVTISSQNYEGMKATINVISVDKMPVNITGVSVAEQEYNGNAVKYTETPRALDSSDNTVMIDSKEYQYTWQTADGRALDGAPKDAGRYLLTVSVDSGTYIGSRTISFVINKASITITANSMTVNKGSAKPALTYAISGLAEGETLNVEPTLTCNADMNTAGRYPITVSGAEVPNSNNYHTEITYVPGALTVTASTSSGGSGSSGGNNNGSGSGSESSGDGGQGGSGDNGSGNTAPGIPALPAATNTNQGTDADIVKPGTGNTARPGTGTKPGSSAAKAERPDTGIPFIKGEDGKIGWNVILAEEEKVEEGSVINVDMNGTAVVPGNIFDSIKGRDITITFDMGNGIIWSVDGKSVTTDKADYIDFSVKTGGSAVPVEIINNVTGEHYSIQLSLAHDGEFGFIAVLSVNLGEENAGYLASLYYYNEDTGELELICADEVAQDGTVSFAFTHASDYVIVVDRVVEEESGIEEAAQMEGTDSAQTQDRTDGNGGAVMESPKEGQSRSRNLTGLIAAGIIALAGIGAGIVVAVKKKKEKEE